MEGIKPSKGLLAQIEDSNKATYKPLTLESYRMILFDMEWDPLRGKLKRELKALFEKGLMIEEKYDNLIKMIDAEDKESIILAQELIKII